MMINLKQSDSQFILAIDSKALQTAGSKGVKVNAYPSSELPLNLDLNKEQIFFTNINKKTGVLSGYKIGNGLVATKMWQLNVKNSESEQLHQVRSQYQTSS